MKTFDQIKGEFGLILKKRKEENLPLELARKQYSSLIKELIEKIKECGRDLDLEDYSIDDNTSPQGLEFKLENIINFIEIQFLSQMGTIQ